VVVGQALSGANDHSQLGFSTAITVTKSYFLGRDKKRKQYQAWRQAAAIVTAFEHLSNSPATASPGAAHDQMAVESENHQAASRI
jgi:hypothetical protein